MIEETLRNIVREELDHKFRDLEKKKAYKQYYSVNDLSKMLAISKQKVRRLYNEGRLSGAKIGGSIIFTETDLQELLDKNRKLVRVQRT